MRQFVTSSRKTAAAFALASTLILSVGSAFAGSDEAEAGQATAATGTVGSTFAANRAKNLARLNCGARVDRFLADGRLVARVDNPGTLLLDDNNLSCPLPVGDSTFVITLPGIATLQRFAFINQNAAGEGDLDFAVSSYRLKPNDSHWKAVDPALQFGGKRILNLPLPAVEAKYVRLTFHVRKAGQLAGLALYGKPTLESFADHHILRAQTNYSVGALKLVTHLEDTLNFNLANEYARAHVVYVSSNGSASTGSMIDDDVSTSFSFAAGDAQPTVIIALGHKGDLHRVSAMYQMPAGKLEVFLLDQLGTPGDLSSARLVATLTGRVADGKAAVDFAPHGARYVALRFTPDKPGTEPIEVAEIGAFGAAPLSVLELDGVTNAFAETSKPGEGSTDFSNGLGTLAAPPVLAPVSP